MNARPGGYEGKGVEKMIKKEIEEYKTFMADPRNEGSCDNCPANEDFSDDWQGRKPCGHYRCWVTMHNGEEE